MVVEDSWVWVESPLTRVTNDGVGELAGQAVASQDGWSELDVPGQHGSGDVVEDGWSGQTWCKYIGGDYSTINKT